MNKETHHLVRLTLHLSRLFPVPGNVSVKRVYFCGALAQYLLHWQYIPFVSFALSKVSVLQNDEDQRPRLTSWLQAGRGKSPDFPLRCLFFFERLKRKQVPGVFCTRLQWVFVLWETRVQTGTTLSPSS